VTGTEHTGRAFEDVVGADHVLRGDPASIDGVPVRQRVQPSSPAQVAECLRAARDAREPVVPAGGRTKLHWGHPPDARAVTLLDTSRLDAPFELDPEEGIGTFGAGVRVGAVEQAAWAAGKRTLAPSVPAQATLGGVIASDPVEPERSSGRRFRDDLLGLEVAVTSGALTRSGGRVVKNVTGFDLVRLYAGSFGTLGVITRVTLRLRPLPGERRCLFRTCASLDEALGVARALLEAGVEPDGVAAIPAPNGVRLLWLLEGGPGELDARAARFPGESAPAEDWTEVAHRVADLESPRPGVARVRIGGRPSDTASIAGALERDLGRDALAIALPLAGIVLAWLPEDALPGWIESAARSQWAVLVERAAPELRARVDVFGRPDASLPLMRALKARFDPDRILAPGRFVGGL
jgi:glycolate oxidase FAD binding subunit